ncbi:hypothetical protein BH10PSE13_BH10PSE13_20710 [soil metagenome]
MKVLILGAAGNTGSRLMGGAIAAGCAVTVLIRDREKFVRCGGPIDHVRVETGDATADAVLDQAMANQDVVINAAGNANDGPVFQALVHGVIAAAERVLGPGGRLWLFGGAAALDIPGTGLVGTDLPGVPAIYQAHRSNYERVRATALDWSMLCPGPMIDSTSGHAHEGLRISIDGLPFPPRPWARIVPRIVHLADFATRLGELTITYEDAAKVILDNLTPGGALSRRRVGVALPTGMRLRKRRAG